VDLNATGDDVTRRQRASYRSPVPGPGWSTYDGNSLALETNHETLGSDDLTTTDLLYISDPSHAWDNGYGYIRVMQVGHPLQDLDASLLPEVDLNDTWPFSDGLKELEIAAPRDYLYIASGIQSFNHGYMGRMKTTDNALNVVDLTYGDLGFLHVDWYDSNKVFITTFDGFYNDPDQGLYLNLVYDKTVVNRLKLMDDYETYDNRDLVYDPQSSRLYLTVGTKIMVVKVKYSYSPPNPGVPIKAYLPIMERGE
jgi:hypothetical protein